jgi:hypothetical protein
MSRSYTSSSPCASMACSGTALLFYFFFITSESIITVWDRTDMVLVFLKPIDVYHVHHKMVGTVLLDCVGF